MLLQELFKKKEIDYVEDAKSNKWYATSVLDDGRSLAVQANKTETSPNNSWELVFSVDGSTDLTGEGGEIEIFSVVANLLRIFMEKYDAGVVHMTAHQANRAKLYVRMFKRELPGWEVISFGDEDSGYAVVASKDGFKVRLNPHRMNIASIEVGPYSIRFYDGETDDDETTEMIRALMPDLFKEAEDMTAPTEE